MENRILTIDELNSVWRGTQKKGCDGSSQSSEQTVRCAYRVVGVSRGHIKPGEKRPGYTCGIIGLTLVKARTVPPAEW